MPDIRFLLKSGWRVAGSEAQRREFRAYMKYIARQGRWRPASRQLIGSIRGGSPAGNLPPNFLAQRHGAGEKLEPHELAVSVTNGELKQESGELRTGIRLATRSLNDFAPPWKNRYDDPEDTFAAHRFGWLLPILAAGPGSEVVLQLGDFARQWIDAHPTSVAGEGWDSYSISERIVNWIFLLAALRVNAPRAEVICGMIRRSLEDQAKTLSAHIEFRGAATNNHLINNGRALYFAGTLIGDSAIQAQGREILRYGLRQMFTGSGFLREGSSHYHLLLCRTYFEVNSYAQQASDWSFVEEIRDPLVAQLKCAAFFSSHAAFPLVGDVSPDSPPQFHQGVAAVGLSALAVGLDAPQPLGRGWHTLWGYNPSSPRGSVSKSRIQSFPDAGYYSVDWDSLKLTVYVNPLGYVPAWSHGHGDMGGFVLEWDGKPIFVDCGRATYESDRFGRYGRSARSHNTIMVDGHEPCVIHAHNGFEPVMGDDYYHRPPEVQTEDRGDLITIRLRHFGFRRLHDDLLATRSFKIASDAVEITDELVGSRSHLVETFFHLHPQVKVERKDGAVKLATEQMRLDFMADTAPLAEYAQWRGSDGRELAGWFSPQYGRREPTTTLKYHQWAILPVRNTFTITPGKG
jgi:hypothetical protein